MRLWHQDLLPILPRAQILGQHRECCALRGKGWGRKHSTVDYVFSHSVIQSMMMPTVKNALLISGRKA
ncbi:pyrimidine dimer DNA glycosylase/endonuclease V [Desulfosporosinus metallidurans]|uniref:pyrimidine dimer DNA glycosylase/endonuclease V n=1 Tax=Desulfosporosinus metallidurans TaxID=1888891 RepID=UPI001F271E83|nr:pyrimidine dimer DNA glycosylase/endonuclease V [Desulfosporosinus metallidurans]